LLLKIFSKLETTVVTRATIYQLTTRRKFATLLVASTISVDGRKMDTIITTTQSQPGVMMAITRTSMTSPIIPTTKGTRMTMTNMTRMMITTMTTMANVIQVSAKSAAIPKPNSMKFA